MLYQFSSVIDGNHPDSGRQAVTVKIIDFFLYPFQHLSCITPLYEQDNSLHDIVKFVKPDYSHAWLRADDNLRNILYKDRDTCMGINNNIADVVG